MDEEVLKSNVICILKRNNVKFRSITIDDDKMYIGIEGTKSKYSQIPSKLKSLRLDLISCVYGRWVLRIR